MVQRRLAKAEFAGSSPVSRSFLKEFAVKLQLEQYGTVHVHLNSKLLWMFPPRKIAVTLGSHMFFRGEAKREYIAHELRHILQWREYGWRFLPIYLWDSLTKGYRYGRFESEAYAHPDWAGADEVLRKLEAPRDGA